MYTTGMADNTYLDASGDVWLTVKNFVALEVKSWKLCECSVRQFFCPKSVSAIAHTTLAISIYGRLLKSGGYQFYVNTLPTK